MPFLRVQSVAMDNKTSMIIIKNYNIILKIEVINEEYTDIWVDKTP